ncbi:Unknown protein sequence [Pseudomonas syringae pv. cilantro]|uniref:Uncharacterized protein n=1 Tax=Pseudomonas syringae pv. cilantro TaxID=81035 RepID=A0A0N0GC98_PSESX|nr:MULTISPECIES: hypothetical protein [Pseudomonas syringae group]KPC23694.1 Unknown protein sequence [Pseudomonas syringae pv. cilantro]
MPRGRLCQKTHAYKAWQSYKPGSVSQSLAELASGLTTTLRQFKLS